LGLSQIRILAAGCLSVVPFAPTTEFERCRKDATFAFEAPPHHRGIKLLQTDTASMKFCSMTILLDRSEVVHEFADRYKKEIGLPFMFSGRWRSWIGQADPAQGGRVPGLVRWSTATRLSP